MAGKGGGAWKVAYADFVTAMMAFFMVMWLTSQKPATKEALGSYFRDPWAQSRLNSNDVRNPTLRDVKAGETDPGKKFMGSNAMLEPHNEPESMESKKPKLTTVRSTDRTAIGTIVVFDEGSVELTEAGKRKLRDLVPKVKGLTYKIEIRGHATQREQYLAGATTGDWQVCYQRSLAVLEYLREQGIEVQRLRLCQASGYEPLTINDEGGEANKNVRVEVFMLNETVESFQGTEAQRAGRTVKKQDDGEESADNDKHEDASHGKHQDASH
jgi:chemotaxis protein MotB